jgi:hypothetical protein
MVLELKSGAVVRVGPRHWGEVRHRLKARSYKPDLTSLSSPGPDLRRSAAGSSHVRRSKADDSDRIRH